MAERGDVLQLKRRLGFGDETAGDRVVVLQATLLNSALPTTVVVPLAAEPAPVPPSLAVRVSAQEAGSSAAQVAVPTHLQVTLLDRFMPGRVGRLRPRTLAELEAKVRLVLDL